MKLVEEMDEKWKEFGNFVCVNKKWRRLYFNYRLFIKNEKINFKDIHEENRPLSAKIIDHSDNPQPKHAEMFSIATLFSENSIFFKAVLEANQLLITNTCLKFEEKTGYDR